MTYARYAGDMYPWIWIKYDHRSKIAPLHLVCRQLYEETAILQFKVNTWAFRGYDEQVLDFFLLQVCMLVQRKAIQTVMVDEDYGVPASRLANALSGLKTLFLYHGIREEYINKYHVEMVGPEESAKDRDKGPWRLNLVECYDIDLQTRLMIPASMGSNSGSTYGIEEGRIVRIS
ncbi:hypothetical protein K458DRAFT_94242 [Lentithecium fluviatile CBS 122367]|uniref:Uncharacterized protein n=1 Tax=Lentithecium fluviatile CBS 122367 TaxID=1168545 RepID=A0A6G1IQY1_9PLEO|nr:hypothetical protein K458DRAFT_94242 [Lentithecium fluviatile CBS 122367]